MISIDPYNRTPIYEQVQNEISELIMLGDLKNGDKLPSVRSLARELGVNPNTVQKAYAELERRQIIYTVSGKGNFVGEQEKVSQRVSEALLDNVRSAAQAAKNNAIPQKAVLDVVVQVYQD